MVRPAAGGTLAAALLAAVVALPGGAHAHGTTSFKQDFFHRRVEFHLHAQLLRHANGRWQLTQTLLGNVALVKRFGLMSRVVPLSFGIDPLSAHCS